MELIKKYIFEKIANKELSHELAKQMLLELQEKNVATDEPIAIIGVDGRFANANNLEEFWSNLRNGLNCIGDFPTERIGDTITHLYENPHYCEFVEGGPIDKKDYYNKSIYAKGSYLDEIDKFDAEFFDIPPREAKYMDPHQRVFLEVAFGAIENAGYSKRKITGTKTGVFLGKENTNISFYKHMSKADALQLTGSWESITVSRLNYFLDLKGPAMMIDAACSSGLISVHMACESIHRGECDMAVAGGICLNILAPQDIHKDGKDLSSVESTDFLVKTFDKNANGTVWGEGVGIVLLKPLSQAIKDRDNIQGVIKASVINNDGTSSGIIAPDAASQEALFLKAWEKAKINPETINYIEAHGTGTVLGDPIEFKGLTNAFRRFTKKKQFCGIGSLKTSLGHLVAASGMASFFKVVMALKNGEIPPSINFNSPNPYINFCDSPLYMTDTLTEWKRQDSPRRAGISSFGFSGTNCHVILEEYIKPEESNVNDQSLHCLTVSAKNENAAMNFVHRYKAFINKNCRVSLENMCFSANTGKDHYAHRFAVIFKDRDDLIAKLDSVVENGFTEIGVGNCYYKVHKIISRKSGTAAEGYIDETEKQEYTDTANELINNYMDSKDINVLSEICKLYVIGADVDWQKLYSRECNIISVPQYPLERTRYWTEPKISKISKQQQFEEKIDHQLLDYCLIKSLDETIYLTEFNVDKHWVLSDHKIMNNCVIPGTTYLEMARAAASFATNEDMLELKDVFFITPLMVPESETVKVHTIIRHIKDNRYEFTIASIHDNDGEKEWLKHAEGAIVVLNEDATDTYNIDEIKSVNSEFVDYSDNGQENTYGVFTFGQRWANVVRANHGTDEVLVELSLSEDIASDLDSLFLHPGMLDNAMNYMSQSSENETYLPFTYKSFKYYKPMEKKIYSHIRKKQNKTGNTETISFDVRLLNENGILLAQINDYVIKKVHNVGSAISASSDSSNSYFEMLWKEIEYSGGESIEGQDSVLIFKGRDQVVSTIVKKLQEKVNLIEVEYGNTFEKLSDTRYIIGNSEHDYERLFSEIKEKRFNRIIHTFALSGKVVESASDLLAAEDLGVYNLYHLVRAAVSNKIKPAKGLVVLADYANCVDMEEPVTNPHNAALFGLAKVIGLEYEQLRCKCIDVDRLTDIDRVIMEIGAQDDYKMVALRNNKRYIEMLSTIDKDQIEQKPLEVKENGVYLITGGTGGLGLAMAGFIASHGKTRLCLVNRSKTAEKSEWSSILEENKDITEIEKIKKLQQLEDSGAQVYCYSANIADETSMREVISSIVKEHGGIDGIIHCAGVAGNGFVINRDENVFRSVIEPKTTGTFLLDVLTEDLNTDFYVMFSTITSLTGDPGQGDYTAAGCYMDSFSAYRNKKGRKTVTINWPIWSETGMAVEYGASDEYTIFRALNNEKAFEAFSFITGASKFRVIPGRINYKFMAMRKDSIPFDFEDDIKMNLIKEEKKFKKEEKGNGGKSIVEVKVTGKPIEDLTEIEKVLIQIWAHVLDVNKLDVYDDFQTVGGDSILTSELLKAINDEYPDVMDISDIYYYNTIVSMAEYIDGIVNSQ